MTIKPCPFCGNTDLAIMDRDTYYQLLGEHGIACVCISCRKCKTDKYNHDYRTGKYEKRIDMLVEEWNRRA